MRIGTVLPNTDPSRVLKDISQEFAKHHQVEHFQFREIKAPIFYYRIERYYKRHDFMRFMERNDVLFFEWASDLLAYASHLPKTCRIVARLHRYEMFTWVDKINWANVDRLIVLTEAMRRKFIERQPQFADRVVVIPWAISTEKFTPTDRPFQGQIGTLCEIIPRKRIYELILVFSQLAQYRPNIHLHIAGNTHPMHMDYVDALHSLVSRLDLEDKVSFNGRVDAVSWHKDIDIFVSNSYSEGLQSALIEAMSTKSYTLSHWWDGAEEILPDENLFFTDRQLFEKLLDYYDATEEAKETQQSQMRDLVSQRFDLAWVLQRIREVVEDAKEPVRS